MKCCDRPPSLVSELLVVPAPPPSSEPSAASTLIPIRTYVSLGSSDIDRIVRARVLPWRAHSGQRMPTGVVVMQSGQIGRSQFEQRTPVSRLRGRQQHPTPGKPPAATPSPPEYA